MLYIQAKPISTWVSTWLLSSDFSFSVSPEMMFYTIENHFKALMDTMKGKYDRNSISYTRPFKSKQKKKFFLLYTLIFAVLKGFSSQQDLNHFE